MTTELAGGRPDRNPCFPRQGGFSIIEIMMTILLVSVTLALAVPSYRDMVEKRQVTNAAEQVAAFINTAQGVAMKTNQAVTVSWSHTGADDWCIGAVGGDTACNCEQTNLAAADYCQIDSMAYVMDASKTGDLELMNAMTGDGAYAFDPVRGLVVGLEEPLGAQIHSPSGDFRLNLVINSTGRVMLCSEDDAHAVPGYELCPQGVVDGGVGDPIIDGGGIEPIDGGGGITPIDGGGGIEPVTGGEVTS